MTTTEPQPSGRGRRQDALWIAVASLIWLLSSALKLQVARITPFDALVGAVFAAILLQRAMTRKRAGVPPRWHLSAPTGYYLTMGVLVCAGLLSGVHASDLKLWSVELLTFVYLFIMLLGVDLFSTGKLERFLKVGGWSFAGLCAFCGLIAGAFLLGGPQFGFFYEINPNGITAKFTGPMRFPNQWAGFFLALFPLLLALNFERLTPSKRAILLACTLLGFVTIPATGSRSGMFLMVAQGGGFLLLYMTLSRSGHVLTRLLYILIFTTALGATYWMLFEQASESPILTRSLGAFELVFEQESLSDRWRDYNWSAAIGEFEKHPLVGMGLGTFERFYDKHEVHSSYLSFAAETGLLGLISYLLLVTVPLLHLLRALAAYAARGRMDTMLIALILGIFSQLLFAIHHNNTRHRHVWMLLLCGLLYAELALLRLRAGWTEHAGQAETSRPGRWRR